VLLQPRFDIFCISLDPRGLGGNGIDALRERHVKALGALVLEERFNVLDVLTMSEAGCCDGDDRAEHAQARGQSPLEFLPVVLDPLPERVAAFLMRPQCRDGQIDVLTLDVLAESKVEGTLDQFRRFGATERTERRVTLVTRGGVEVLLDNGVILSCVSIGLVGNWR
jgi:hypothetical protein